MIADIAAGSVSTGGVVDGRDNYEDNHAAKNANVCVIRQKDYSWHSFHNGVIAWLYDSLTC